MTTGVVKNWIRGYGFIKAEDGTEVFVHNSEIQGRDSLNEGEKVEFDVEQGPKGPRAVNVKIIS